jgi:hypothetical protein
MAWLTSWSRSATGKRTLVERRVCGGSGSDIVEIRIREVCGVEQEYQRWPAAWWLFVSWVISRM